MSGSEGAGAERGGAIDLTDLTRATDALKVAIDEAKRAGYPPGAFENVTAKAFGVSGQASRVQAEAIKRTTESIAEVTRILAMVARAMAALNERVSALESRVGALPPGG